MQAVCLHLHVVNVDLIDIRNKTVSFYNYTAFVLIHL